MSEIIKLDYEYLVGESLRLVVRNALAQVSNSGLPGDHHFYITFLTNYPEVDIPDHLMEEYPEEMTIVLQHQFWDLRVTEDFFFVTLCFNDVYNRLAIPSKAIVSFVDPSVKFGLQFSQN